MLPLSATRTSTISVRNDRSINLVYTGDAADRTEPFKGFSHLLQDTTLEEVLGQPDLDYRHAEIIRRALVDGIFPCIQNDSEAVQFLACWLAQHKQARLLCHWLTLTPLSIGVLTEETAGGLLAIAQSRLSLSNLRLDFATYLQTNILREVIRLVAQAFQANDSLTRIGIFGDDYETGGMSPLFDVLADIAGLELIMEAGAMRPSDFALLGKLLSRNKALRVFELANHADGTLDHQMVVPGAGCVAAAIKQLAGQLQLKRLELSDVPLQCQAVIGELMCTSHALKELKISLDGTMVDAALINGFSKTSSVESVHLTVTWLEDDMLQLIDSIADSNTSIKNLELRCRYCRLHLNDSPAIYRLISGNRYLASLIWRLPTNYHIDLPQIGMALEKNIGLETLMLIRQTVPEGWEEPGWINEASISALAVNLKKNHTLTELVLASEAEFLSSVKKNYSVLQQVLDRNSAFRRHACSDAFMRGAVEGLFATMALPVDTAVGTARALMHYRPRIGAAALALINKASYAQAVFRRREAHATMLEHLLPITEDLVVNNRQKMIELLYGLKLENGDFSNEDVTRIADSSTLPGALVAILFRSPHDYLALASVFCQAVGMDKIRTCLIKEIAKDDMLDANEPAGTGTVFLLSMLEKSFPPDQKHLLPFVEKELDYDSINSAAVKLFVGYEIPRVISLASNKAKLASWCVENRQPGVLIAFYEAYGSKVIIDFAKYSGGFARNMMAKSPQLKKARILSLKGIPDYEDALVLHRVLAGTSAFKELHVDGSCCGQEFDCIMQGLNSNRRITSLSLKAREMSHPPAIRDTLANLLEANSRIKEIFVGLYDDDPEWPELRQLAAMDDRLELQQVERPDDSDEAPEQ